MFAFFKEIEKQIEKENDKIVIKFSNRTDKIKVYLLLLSKIDLLGFRLDNNSYFNISFAVLLEKYFWKKGYYIPKGAHDADKIVVQKKNRIVYTAIFGRKDKLLRPAYIPHNFDFLCYTDDNLKSAIWKVIREKATDKDPVRAAKIYKILSQKYLKNYDYSVWVDGNLRVIGNLNKLVDEYLKDSSLAVFDHMQSYDKRNCIFEEAEALIDMAKIGKKKEDPKKVLRQINDYKKEGYPKNNGLITGMIIVREHNSKDVVKLMEDWWGEICKYSRRDQLSFNYVAWKNNFKIHYIPGDSRDNEFFKRQKHVIK